MTCDKDAGPIKTLEEAQAVIRAHPGIMAPIHIMKPDGIDAEKVWQSKFIFDLHEEIVKYIEKLLAHKKGELYTEIKKIKDLAFCPENDFRYTSQNGLIGILDCEVQGCEDED